MEVTAEIKERLFLLLAGDNASASESILQKAYSEAVNELLQICEPLSLISRDSVNYKTVRCLDARYFLRKPESIEELREVGLVEAVIYLTAARLASFERKNALIERAKDAAESYTAGLFAYLEAVGFRGRAGGRDDIPFLLESYGWERAYDTEWGGVGARYIWKEDIVNALDRFMLKGGAISRCLARTYQDYLSWADGAPLNQADAEACGTLDKLLLKRGRGFYGQYS